MPEDQLVTVLLLVPATIALIPLSYVLLTAMQGQRWAVMFLFFATVILLESAFRSREYSDKSIDFQSVLKALSFGLMFAFSALRLHRYAGVFFTFPHLLWVLFFCWLLYTTLAAPNPLYSAFAVFSIIALYVTCLALRTDYDDTIVVTLVAALMLVAVVSLIVYVFAPSLGRVQEWEGDVHVLGSRLSGVAGNPNAIGRLSGLCMILVVIQWRDLRQHLGRTILSFGTASSLLALVLSQSRTAMAIVIALLGVHVAFRTRYLPFLMISGAVAATVLAILVSNDGDQFLSLLARSGDSTEIETGTRRTQIWATIIRLAQSNFWTGSGYASTSFILPAYSEYVGFTTPHAHNLWLELWFTTGMIGVTLFSVALVGQITNAVAHRDGLSLSLLAFVTLNGITEVSAFGGVANIMTLALVMAAARTIRPLSVRLRE